ncbi:MAG: selenocysteine-specific translation elongation factor [Candidatus Cloacimonadota bacterium]|nr:selenocysteine-specific translation elongation factor [Candidatus Cloacimonadota bacterium]
MKHFTMGTAGHVDHGKTALIKALTQFDCDTHKEEKERGITINLGFTHLEISEDESIGIIDVPGHKDFINTMVAGASTIDFVMLVIAADSGIMPQTIEHLNIMKILGIDRGFVVLTKTDLVDEELLLLAEEEISDFVSGTFLEEFPVIKTSVKSGEGLNDVRECIAKIIETDKKHSVADVFRMYIDRIFTVQGFGTVINGSALGGSISQDDKLYLLPDEKELRIRSIQRFGNEVKKVFRGDRTSINIVGLSKNEFKSGMVVADRIIKGSKMLDARIEIFEHDRTIGTRTDVIFLLGTYAAQARMHLLDNDQLSPKQSGLVQFHLDFPCVAIYGDRFVIRSTSNDVTLGGGEIVDTHPLHHRRRTEKMVNNLSQLVRDGLRGLIVAELKKRKMCLSTAKIAKSLGVSQKKIEDTVFSSNEKDLSVVSENTTHYLIIKELKENLKNRILEDLRMYHERNYLDVQGKNFQEIMGIFNAKRYKEMKKMIQIMIEELEQNGKLKRVGNTWTLSSYKVNISASDKKQIEIVEEYFKNLGFNNPKTKIIHNEMKLHGIEENKFQLIVIYLVNTKVLKNVEGNFIHSQIYEQAKEKLLDFLNKNLGGIKVGEFRDILHSNRTFTMNVLKIFDDEGVTARRGDRRVLKGKSAPQK